MSETLPETTRHAPGRAVLRAACVSALLFVTIGAPAAAQWVTTHDQFYRQSSHNWQFRRNYPAADRLFNAFDYGHAILYERLWTAPNEPVAALEQREYDFITRRLLVSPPRVPLEEAAIEVEYAKLVPEAKHMFDWAHVLHRQVYDVWADERIPVDRKDAEVNRLLRYYRSRPDIAFSGKPKSMDLMEGQPYSLSFRRRYPKFNGLIWAYHWLQVGLYEPLVTASTSEARQSGVAAAVTRFRQMLEAPPSRMPSVMPMTAAIAPEFSRRYPEIAIIFDNLHAMHDVISDVLTDARIPRSRKRAEILLAARRYRDDTTAVVSEADWRSMSIAMGIAEQGGPAVGPVEVGPTSAARTAAGGHANHGARSDSTTPRDSSAVSPERGADAMVRLLMALLEDPAVRARIAADPALRRATEQAIRALPLEHRDHLLDMLGEPRTPPPPDSLRSSGAEPSGAARPGSP
jgi:hypothetical protein